MKNICIIIYKKINKIYISAIPIPYFLKNCSIVVPYWYPCPYLLRRESVVDESWIEIPCNTQKVLHGCNSFFSLIFSKLAWWMNHGLRSHAILKKYYMGAILLFLSYFQNFSLFAF